MDDSRKGRSLMASKGRERRRRAHLRALARTDRRGKRQMRRRMVRWVLIGFGGLGGLAIILSMVLPGNLSGGGGASNAVPGDSGRLLPNQGVEHIDVGEDHPLYNSTPPTSGWHYEQPDAPADWGIYDEPIADEVQVHNLEHGGIMVQYYCPEECPELVGQLEDAVDDYAMGIILAPYPEMESTIALTAWRWIDEFDEFDEQRIDDFIRDHIDQAPERLH